MITLPHIPAGKRAVVVGRTGTGKTQLAVWLCQRSPGVWIILNPKCVDYFDSLGPAVRGFDLAAIGKHLTKEPDERPKFIVVYPPEGADPAEFDAFILDLHRSWENVGLYVDELYSVQLGVRPGRGLTAWLTQGRGLSQSFCGLAQRPAWISNFVFSEADYFASLALSLDADRKKIIDNSGRTEFGENIERDFAWRWYDVAKNRLRSFGPVPRFAEKT